MNLARISMALQPYVPPRLWATRHHVETWAQWLRHGGLGDVARNAELRGRYRGQRAFVVGNGPSLNRMDLTRLRDEKVFTVNSFFKFQARWGIRAFCHTMIDPWYFETDSRDLDELARTAAPETKLFFPLKYKRAVASRFAQPQFLLFSGDSQTNANTDLAKAIGGVRTVTIAAVLVALYLGFSPIYLIGCDMDMMSHVVGVAPLRVALRHFYDDAAPEENELPDLDYAGYCHSMCIALAGYRFVRDVLRPDQQVLNAGLGGMLDTFPRVDYDSLFG